MSSRSPAHGSATARLVGIGACTTELEHEMHSGEAIVLGRHEECTLAIARSSARGDHVALVSRQHAVVEDDPTLGWCVYDTGSTNGTVLLRGGYPPAVKLAPGIRHRLRPGGVVGLRGNGEV